MIYIMYLNCMLDILILAQVVLKLFRSQGCFTTQDAKKSEKGDDSVKYLENFVKS